MRSSVIVTRGADEILSEWDRILDPFQEARARRKWNNLGDVSRRHEESSAGPAQEDLHGVHLGHHLVSAHAQTTFSGFGILSQ